MAAGFGVRLREIIHGRPKHLAPVNGVPFLRHLIRLLKLKHIDHVILSIGYLSRYIKEEFKHDHEGIKLSFSEDSRPLGTAGSLKKAQTYFQSDFLVINGDTYLDIDYQDLITSHQKAKALITLVGTTAKKQKGGLIIAANNQVKDFITKTPTKPLANSFRHAGVYAVSPQIFKYIPDQAKTSLEKDVIPKLLKTGQKVMLYSTDKTFLDIGTIEGFNQARKYLK